MKGIATPGQGVGYLTLRSLHSLGNGPIVIVPLPSFRWGMRREKIVTCIFVSGLQV
jgi:hypothetical protein